LIAGIVEHSSVPAGKLKQAAELLDHQSLLPESLWQLCRWTASYYQHGLGDTLSSALPVLLRQGEPALARQDMLWQLLPGAFPEDRAVSRAPEQIQAVPTLAMQPLGVSHALLTQWGLTRDGLESLERKGLGQRITHAPHPSNEPRPLLREPALQPNDEQQPAL